MTCTRIAQTLAASLLAAATFAGPTSAENLVWTAQFHGPDGSERVGLTVAVWGDQMLFSVPGWGRPGGKLAYLYPLDGAELSASFTPPDPNWYGDFGHHVVLGPDQALICGDSYGEDAGGTKRRSVMVYDRATGQMVSRLDNPVTQDHNDSDFGEACAMDWPYVLVGAPKADEGGKTAGAAFLFDGRTGALLRSFQTESPEDGPKFGSQVALMGDWVGILEREGTGILRPGIIRLYDRDTGELRNTIRQPAGHVGGFGSSLVMRDGRLAVGATFSELEGVSTGLAYLYDVETGTLLMQLAPPRGREDSLYGRSVAISGGRVLVGSPDAVVDGVEAGAAYLYDAESGLLLQELDNPTPEEMDIYGLSVALSEAGAAVGAFRDGSSGVSTGAIYAYRFAQ